MSLRSGRQRAVEGRRKATEFDAFFRKAHRLDCSPPPQATVTQRALEEELTAPGPPAEIVFNVPREFAQHAEWSTRRRELLREIISAEEPLVSLEEMLANKGEPPRCAEAIRRDAAERAART